VLLPFIFLVCLCPGLIYPTLAVLSEEAGAGRRLIALLTDFGNNDFYVPTLKGAIYAVDPDARVVDLTHEVPPFNIREAAFLMAESSREFPAGVVFVGIVDPGVGTARKPIVIRTGDGSFFVGPDNGMLIEAAEIRKIVEVREISNQEYMRRGARSTTFHGRDMFGPVGAFLARGKSFAGVGPRVESWVTLTRKPPDARKGRASGEVVHADAYGNLLTNLTDQEMKTAGFKKGARLMISVGDNRFPAPYAGTYGDVAEGSRVVTVGSTGRVEIAINAGSLAESLGAGAGDPVTLEAEGGGIPRDLGLDPAKGPD
jgi:S-adenosylmethionine hydrolase